MPKAALVKRGEEYLPGVPPAELEAMYRRERPGRSRDRLQAAVLRKQDEMLEKIAGMTGRGARTIHRWLSRMGREGPEAIHDNKGPGRPRPSNPERGRTIKGDLDGTPRECGFERQQLERQNGRQAHTGSVRCTVQQQVGHQAGAPAGTPGQKAADPSRRTAPRRRVGSLPVSVGLSGRSIP